MKINLIRFSLVLLTAAMGFLGAGCRQTGVNTGGPVPETMTNQTTNQTSNTSGGLTVPQSNIAQNQAIKIAQGWVEANYPTKSDNFTVNATMSNSGNVTVWNVVITGLAIILDNGPPDPQGRLFHDVSIANVTINAKTGAIITATAGARRVFDQ